jgi:hypothetical protein
MSNIDKTVKSNAEEQAEAQYRSICLLLEAVDFYYDEYDEMVNELEAYKGELSDAVAEHGAGDVIALEPFLHNVDTAEEWLKENAKPFDDIDNAEDAGYRLREDALEVQVRTDWHDFGDTDTQTPSEFYILLCTGGPAVRIRGELDEYGTPTRAWLEYYDWGTPWTHLYVKDSNAVLCRYASYYLGC